MQRAVGPGEPGQLQPDPSRAGLAALWSDLGPPRRQAAEGDPRGRSLSARSTRAAIPAHSSA